ncbi:hypothetical protein APHAL10511_008520 [Amanita phalloides]|nr:hypothetical protein APHAL10511_008520 [Amanita phalloides]
MSLPRALLTSAQAFANHLACTPPNPSLQKHRYHTEQCWLLQIAPFVFRASSYLHLPSRSLDTTYQVHMTILWICAAFEWLLYASTLVPLPPALSPSPSSAASVRASPLFFIGTLSIFLGAYIRLDCFRTLGELFTFDLTIHPQHRLVTKRFYAYVRHPAYTGSLLLIAGIAFSHLTDGAWLTECGPLRVPGLAFVVWALWWAWTLSVGISRAIAEDGQMRKLFQDEWDRYAANVHWWFFPGIL